MHPPLMGNEISTSAFESLWRVGMRLLEEQLPTGLPSRSNSPSGVCSGHGRTAPCQL